jgi:indolepyruvate ferredoxin oxidoreductase
VKDYKRSVEDILALLSKNNLAQALVLARIPEQIKGFGHVKAKNLAGARVQWQAAELALRTAETVPHTQAA